MDSLPPFDLKVIPPHLIVNPAKRAQDEFEKSIDNMIQMSKDQCANKTKILSNKIEQLQNKINQKTKQIDESTATSRPTFVNELESVLERKSKSELEAFMVNNSPDGFFSPLQTQKPEVLLSLLSQVANCYDKGSNFKVKSNVEKWVLYALLDLDPAQDLIKNYGNGIVNAYQKLIDDNKFPVTRTSNKMITKQIVAVVKSLLSDLPN